MYQDPMSKSNQAPHQEPSWLSYIGFAIAAVSMFVILKSSQHFRVDDAYIYSDYIRNALRHHGLVFNDGEHVNALTSSLYAYLLLVLSAATSNIAFSELLIFSICLILTTFLIVLQAQDLVSRSAGAFASILILSTPYLYILIGMEATLFLCTLVASLFCFVSHRYFLLAVCLACCVFSRYEGGLLIPLMALEHRRLGRSTPKWACVIAPICIVATLLLLNKIFCGDILPHSSSAKFAHARSGYWGHWPFAFFHAKYHLKIWKDFYVLLVICAVTGYFGLREVWSTSWSRLTFRFLMGLLAFYVLFNIPGYPWYYAPFVFFLLVYAGLGLGVLLRDTPTGAKVCVLLLIAMYGTYFTSRRVAAMQTRELQYSFLDYREIGLWFDQHTDKDATIETDEIGVLKWYSERRVIDILGITEPRNADFIGRRMPNTWLSVDTPDYIVIHEKPYKYEVVALSDPRYVEVEGIRMSGYHILRRRDVHPH